MSMALDVFGRSRETTPPFDSHRRHVGALVALDDRSSGAGLVRAVLLGLACWGVIIGVVWACIG